jgi:CheY-like chemotaxis protein
MGTILVVDDEPAIRTLLAELLRDEGYAVLAAADGLLAQEVLERLVPDLVLTDMMMPRLDGLGLLRWMHERVDLRAVPVVLMSAVAHRDADAAGAIHFVAKPFNLVTLLTVVASALGRPSS